MTILLFGMDVEHLIKYKKNTKVLYLPYMTSNKKIKALCYLQLQKLKIRKTEKLRTHLTTEHQMEAEPGDLGALAQAFEVHIEKGHKTALARQVHQAITIGKARYNLLSNKDEYTRCTIPSLHMTPSPTDKPVKEPTHPTDKEVSESIVPKRHRNGDKSIEVQRRKRPRFETPQESTPPRRRERTFKVPERPEHRSASRSPEVQEPRSSCPETEEAT